MSEDEFMRIMKEYICVPLIFLVSFLGLGVVFWKAIILALGIALMATLHLGIRWLPRAAVAIFALFTLVWIDFLPPPNQWKSTALEFIVALKK